MNPELGRRLLRAYYQLGEQDREGIHRRDAGATLDRIAADAGIELYDNVNPKKPFDERTD